MIEFLLLKNKHSGLGFVRNNFSEVSSVPNSCPRGNPVIYGVRSLGTLKIGQTAIRPTEVGIAEGTVLFLWLKT